MRIYCVILNNLILALGISLIGINSLSGIAMALVFMLTLAFSTIISRALFYVLVIPTTMPGAFFWKNRGFQEHAVESGLARMPQVGVIADAH